MIDVSSAFFASAQPFVEGQGIPGAHLALCLKPEAFHLHELPLQACHQVSVLLYTRLLHVELACQPLQLFFLLPQLRLHPSSIFSASTAQVLDNRTSPLSHTTCAKHKTGMQEICRHAKTLQDIWLGAIIYDFIDSHNSSDIHGDY